MALRNDRRIFGWLLGTIFGFLVKLVMLLIMGIYDLLVSMLGGLWWLVPAILAIAVIAFLFKSQGDARETLKTIALVLLFVAGGGAVFWLLRWLLSARRRYPHGYELSSECGRS